MIIIYIMLCFCDYFLFWSPKTSDTLVTSPKSSGTLVSCSPFERFGDGTCCQSTCNNPIFFISMGFGYSIRFKQLAKSLLASCMWYEEKVESEYFLIPLMFEYSTNVQWGFGLVMSCENVSVCGRQFFHRIQMSPKWEDGFNSAKHRNGRRLPSVSRDE